MNDDINIGGVLGSFGGNLGDKILKLAQAPISQVVWNEKMTHANVINQALVRASEDERFKLLCDMVSFVVKGDSGLEYVIRSTTMHHLATVTVIKREGWQFRKDGELLFVIWQNIPGVFHLYDTNGFYEEFKQNGLFYVIGESDVMKKYIAEDGFIITSFSLKHLDQRLHGSEILFPLEVAGIGRR